MPALRVELVAEEGRAAEDLPALQESVLEQAETEGDSGIMIIKYVATLIIWIILSVVFLMPSSIMFNEDTHNDNWGYIDETGMSQNPALLLTVSEWFEAYGWKTFIVVFLLGSLAGYAICDILHERNRKCDDHD